LILASLLWKYEVFQANRHYIEGLTTFIPLNVFELALAEINTSPQNIYSIFYDFYSNFHSSFPLRFLNIDATDEHKKEKNVE